MNEKTTDINKPTFVVCGNIRIKLSNIKEYGLSTGTIDCVIRRKVKPNQARMMYHQSLFKTILEPIEIIEVGREYYMTDMNYGSLYEYDIHECISVKYLYITTFQKDNYVFYDKISKFNIFDKIKEIDKYMT